MTRLSSPGDETVTFHYAREEHGQPVVAIVEAVSWITGVDRLDLEPLGGAVDVARLTRAFEPRGRSASRTDDRTKHNDLAVTFPYEGCRVTLTADRIMVERG